MRAHSAFGNDNDHRLSRPRSVFAHRHSAHADADRDLTFVECQEREINPLEVTLFDSTRGEIKAGYLDARFCAVDPADNVRGGNDKTIAQVNAVARPRLWRILDDVDGVDP